MRVLSYLFPQNFALKNILIQLHYNLSLHSFVKEIELSDLYYTQNAKVDRKLQFIPSIHLKPLPSGKRMTKCRQYATFCPSNSVKATN